jgi:hypothetical protein
MMNAVPRKRFALYRLAIVLWMISPLPAQAEQPNDEQAASTPRNSLNVPSGKAAPEQVPPAHALGTERITQLTDFVEMNCVGCHDGDGGEGGFDATGLVEQTVSSTNAANQHQPNQHQPNLHELGLERWIRVFDRVNDGEMPPPEDVELDASERDGFLDSLYRFVDEVQSSEHRQFGRVRSRRLTNDQLTWSLGDLLSIDLPLAELMPEEQRTDGFRNIADAQPMSHHHLQDHLRVVDHALDFAFDRAAGKHGPEVIDLPADRIANKRKGQRNRDPELREGAAVIWSCNMSFYGRISRSRVPESGWYDITLDASAIKLPKDRNLWCSIRSGECVSRAPLMYWIDGFEVTPEKNTFHFTAWIEKGHLLEIRPADTTLKKARFRGGQVGYGEGESQDVPGIAMHSLELKRIYPGGTVDDVQQSLFGDLDVSYNPETKQFELSSDSPASDSPASDSPASELKRQLQRFADAAFRRPVDEAVLSPYFEEIDRALAEGEPAIETLRHAYRAILCSPRFIYFTEAPGRLDDHAIANRLSYMLTGRAPDEALREAADQGALADHEVLLTHTRRLLNSDSLAHFVADFTDQWLDLAEIDSTEPDGRMFRDFDLVVQSAMLEETRRFIRTAISDNLPINQLIDADFTWLNERLARYYDLDYEITPNEWERVSLADHPTRGGLMTHGAILKVTANGTNTSPVVRGVWICNRLLGIPIPEPPANVPAIEPDVRGAETIREILEKHRSQTECASCHARIDPPGFALEKFDAAGKWRENYLVRSGRGYKKGPPIDVAYQLADGQAFDSFAEFRRLAAQRDDSVARNFAAQLITYATGRETTFADRKALDRIVEQTADGQHRVISLIEAVVTSEPFLSK